MKQLGLHVGYRKRQQDSGINGYPYLSSLSCLPKSLLARNILDVLYLWLYPDGDFTWHVFRKRFLFGREGSDIYISASLGYIFVLGI